MTTTEALIADMPSEVEMPAAAVWVAWAAWAVWAAWNDVIEPMTTSILFPQEINSSSR